MKISQYHSQIIVQLADGIIDEIDTASRLYANRIDIRNAIHFILQRRLRRAYELGCSAPKQQPLPGKPRMDLGPHLKTLGLAKNEETTPKVRS